MNLYDAAKQYMVYIQALRLPADSMEAYRRVMRNVIWFYGAKKPLEAFDNTTTLQYIKLFDPFDCDPIHEERGNIYCMFVHWLMQNKMIPAWSDQASAMKEWISVEIDEGGSFADPRWS